MTSSVAAIDAGGVTTEQGQHYDVDTIVWGTGFKVRNSDDATLRFGGSKKIKIKIK